MKKRLLALLSAIVLMGSVSLAENTEESAETPATAEPLVSLPIDFSPGMPADPDGFTLGDGTWSYEDPTISVQVTQKRKAECDYWVAHIKIADASQLRTMSAGGFDSTRTVKGTIMAKRSNAILAIDGDYFCYTGIGYIVRQGTEYLDHLRGDRDVLLIDDDGDFHYVLRPKRNSLDGTVDGKKVINSFFFGPVLVREGKAVLNPMAEGMAFDEPRQRMAIAQVGPLEYMAICCASQARGSMGMTLQQFAKLCADEGAYIAYNLDGGDSTMMIFNGEKINDVLNENTRAISDIVYFASAWTGEEADE